MDIVSILLNEEKNKANKNFFFKTIEVKNIFFKSDRFVYIYIYMLRI